MKNYTTKIIKILVLFLMIFLIFINTSYAQKASAELVTKIDPAALESGENVGDGVRQVLWHQNKLFITNLWSGLQIVDVRDYKNPKEIGHFYNDDKAHNTFIEDNYAYISDELDGVKIVDISDPSRP